MKNQVLATLKCCQHVCAENQIRLSCQLSIQFQYYDMEKWMPLHLASFLCKLVTMFLAANIYSLKVCGWTTIYPTGSSKGFSKL